VRQDLVKNWPIYYALDQNWMEYMLTIEANAKINLALDVVADLTNGYHEVDMIMQAISLADRITIEPNQNIELTCTNPIIPTDQRNLAWRAVELLQKETGITDGVKIHIEKWIPAAAGLAGGSTDAAAVLIGLNQLWNLGFDNERLMQLGLKLGADVPFCIMGKTARAQGIGEVLTRIDTTMNCNLLLITPNIEVSTALIYQSLNTPEIKNHPQIDQAIAALKANDLECLTKNWGNVLEEVVFNKFPSVAALKQLLINEFNTDRVLMSGSGPSIFVLEPDLNKVESVKKLLPAGCFCAMTQFL